MRGFVLRNWTCLVFVASLAIGLQTAVPSRGWSQSRPQVDKQSNSAILNARKHLFLNYSKDFLGFGRAHTREDIEFSATSELQVAASETADYLDAAETILIMYETLVCKEDRSLLLPLVKHQLEYYSKQIDNQSLVVNHALTYVKSTATAQLGIRMQDDLREVSGTLDSMAASMH